MYTLSEFRDLIFHVKEHVYTIPGIKNSLFELDLKFCGFMNRRAIDLFKKEGFNPLKIYDLDEWHRLEKKNTQLFFPEMYQFVCQKL